MAMVFRWRWWHQVRGGMGEAGECGGTCLRSGNNNRHRYVFVINFTNKRINFSCTLFIFLWLKVFLISEFLCSVKIYSVENILMSLLFATTQLRNFPKRDVEVTDTKWKIEAIMDKITQTGEKNEECLYSRTLKPVSECCWLHCGGLFPQENTFTK